MLTKISLAFALVIAASPPYRHLLDILLRSPPPRWIARIPIGGPARARCHVLNSNAEREQRCDQSWDIA